MELVLHFILHNINAMTTFPNGQVLHNCISGDVLGLQGILCQLLGLRQVGDLLVQIGQRLLQNLLPLREETEMSNMQQKIDVFVVVDSLYIALFSILEQTQCARMGFYKSD